MKRGLGVGVEHTVQLMQSTKARVPLTRTCRTAETCRRATCRVDVERSRAFLGAVRSREVLLLTQQKVVFLEIGHDTPLSHSVNLCTRIYNGAQMTPSNSKL